MRTLGLKSLPGLSELGPNFQFVAQTLFQFEYRIMVLIQLAIGIRNCPDCVIFDRQLLALVRSMHDIPSGGVTRSEIMDRIRLAFDTS